MRPTVRSLRFIATGVLSLLICIAPLQLFAQESTAAVAFASDGHLKMLYDNRMHPAAIAHEGSTLSDGTYRNAVSRNGRYQNEHRVYARASEPCPTCGKVPIQRIVQAQRSTFFCPACQRSK